MKESWICSGASLSSHFRICSGTSLYSRFRICSGTSLSLISGFALLLPSPPISGFALVLSSPPISGFALLLPFCKSTLLRNETIFVMIFSNDLILHQDHSIDLDLRSEDFKIILMILIFDLKILRSLK